MEAARDVLNCVGSSELVGSFDRHGAGRECVRVCWCERGKENWVDIRNGWEREPDALDVLDGPFFFFFFPFFLLLFF